MIRNKIIETKPNDSKSNELDPQIAKLLSKIPNEPSLEELKKWLIDNEVILDKSLFQTSSEINYSMILNIQFDFSTLVEDINGSEESDIFDIVGKKLFLKIKAALNRKIIINTPNLPSFKGYNDRPIACNGDCGSKFAKMINNCIYQRVEHFIKFVV